MTADPETLERLFEGAPRFITRLQAAGPFDDDEQLFSAARSIAHTMPEAEQIELLDAHPRLGAPPGSVSIMSHAEQGYDRGTGMTVDVANELERLNDAYEARFGFRYCVFVAGRPREALLHDFAATLDGDTDDGDADDGDTDRDFERHRALDAVIDIAIDRRAKLSQEVQR